ncbi:MAG: hypothetical protein JSV99_04075 [Planctomycetota bacterium]|nr:MAG: hypothetical protein JSV99_04075 [Planctomycetota bacterium]
MTGEKKKLVMLGVIVVCFGLAVAITVYRRHVEGSGLKGIESINPEDMIWVKCDNAECEAEYQTGKRDYFEYLEANPPTGEQFVAMMTDPNIKTATPLVCKECRQKSVYRGEKCYKCGLVFFRGTIRHDFADRCPGCGHSVTEEKRREARRGSTEVVE